MRTLTVNTPIPHKMNVPTWFMNNRGSGGIVFENLQNSGMIEEISSYKAMREYMLKFSSDSIFLDIGAQMGLSTLSIASEGFRVIAVEPVSRNISFLTESINLNNFDNVTIAPVAAFNDNVELKMYVPVEEDLASLSKFSAEITGCNDLSEEVVKGVRIYDWLVENSIDIDKIKFVKIDVQGAEEMVLEGMTELLDREISILIEWDPRMMRSMGTDENTLYKKMVDLNFTATKWGHDDILFTKQI
jgi:FkbM family methyltransferase